MKLKIFFLFILSLIISLQFASSLDLSIYSTSVNNASQNVILNKILNTSWYLSILAINSSYPYDNNFQALGGTINNTLWFNTSTTCPVSPTTTGGKNYIYANCNAIANNYADVISRTFPNLTLIAQINVSVGLGIGTSSGGGGSCAYNLSIGNVLVESYPLGACDLTNGGNLTRFYNYIFTRINTTSFNVSRNGTYYKTITPTNSNISCGVRSASNTYGTECYLGNPFYALTENYTFRNSTLFVWDSVGTLINTTTKTISGILNTTLITASNISFGNVKYNAYTCMFNGSNSYCSFATANSTANVGITENSWSYNSTTSSGFNENYLLNLTINESISLTGANLIWNNVSYSSTITSVSSTQYLLTKSITIPNINQNVQFFYALTFSDGQQINTSTQSQYVYSFGVDNCTRFTKRVFNISLYDETYLTAINGTGDLLFDFYDSTGANLISTYNASLSINAPNGIGICLNSSITPNYLVNYQIKYYANSTYTNEYKFRQNYEVTNSTSNKIDLYLIGDAEQTPFTITITGSNPSQVENVVIDIQRQYVSLNQYISVESPLTDNDGLAIGHLVAEDIYYDFVVSKDGVVLATFNGYRVQCQNVVTGDCRVTLNLALSNPTISSFENYGNISTYFSTSQNPNTAIFSFISSDGQDHLVNFNVSVFDSYGNNTICSSSITGTVGTFNCQVPSSYGNKSVIGYIYSDGLYLGTNIFSFGELASEVFGGTRVVLGIIMYSVLTLMFFEIPVMAIFGAIIAFIAMSLFIVVDGGTTIGSTFVIGWFIVAGVILIYMINKKR